MGHFMLLFAELRKALFKGYGAASGHKETETDVSGMRNKQIYEQQKKTMEGENTCIYLYIHLALHFSL